MKGVVLAAVALVTGCGDDVHPAADGGPHPDDAAPAIDAGPKGDRWFQESAKILTLREQTGLYLDEQRADEIDMLLARAKMVDIDAEDIIIMNIFARPAEMMDRIYLQSSEPVMQATWERGELQTGNEELDALLASLEPSKIEPVPFDVVQLWFARWVKYDALVARLEEFPFLYVSPVCHCIDGDDIELSDEESAARFTFYVRWDDCFSGCLNSHWWEVVVPHDPEEPAQLTAEGGDPL